MQIYKLVLSDIGVQEENKAVQPIIQMKVSFHAY